jgi:hypothetical protein
MVIEKNRKRRDLEEIKGGSEGVRIEGSVSSSTS